MSDPENIAPMSEDSLSDHNNNNNHAPMSDDSDNSSTSVTSRPRITNLELIHRAGAATVQNAFRQVTIAGETDPAALPPPQLFRVMRDLHDYALLSRMRKAVEEKSDKLVIARSAAQASSSTEIQELENEIRVIESVMEGERDLNLIRSELENVNQIWVSCLEECNAVVELNGVCGWKPKIAIFGAGCNAETDVQAMVQTLASVSLPIDGIHY